MNVMHTRALFEFAAFYSLQMIHSIWSMAMSPEPKAKAFGFIEMMYWKSLKFWQFFFILMPLLYSNKGTVALSLTKSISMFKRSTNKWE